MDALTNVARAFSVGAGTIALASVLFAVGGFLDRATHGEPPQPASRPLHSLHRQYDFIIVGGGSAGSVLANRLTERKHWKVLLLEAGGPEKDYMDVPFLAFNLQNSSVDWRYHTEPQQFSHRGMEEQRSVWPRGKVLGGTSTINGMLYLRGHPRDFNKWESLGNPGWGWRDVLRYFLKSEDRRGGSGLSPIPGHGRGGHLTVSDPVYETPLASAFIQAGEEMGYRHIDLNAENQEGFSKPQLTIRRGARCSAGRAFLRPVSHRHNLHVSLHSHVTRVLVHPHTKHALGVQFEREGRTVTATATREVILSAGTVNSAQLLLLSGLGPRDHLAHMGIPLVHHLPGVGQNLQDHAGVRGVTIFLEKPVTLLTSDPIKPGPVAQYSFLRKGPLTSPVAVEGVAYISTKHVDPSHHHPDIEIVMSSASTNRLRSIKYTPVVEEFLKRYGNRNLISLTAFPLRPRSRGFIKLRSKDPKEPPIIDPRYLSDPHDVKVLVEGIKVTLSLAKTKAFRQYGASVMKEHIPGCEEHELDSDEYYECVSRVFTYTIYHPIGTCKMGPREDPNAVVDPSLRVHGIKGLRVVDASIMPNMISGHTNAATIMIAEKASDLIKQAWWI